MDQLRTWLDEHNAKRISEGTLGNSALEGYSVNGNLLIVMRLPDNGWDLFVPACRDNDGASALKAAGQSLGLNS